MSEEQRSHKAAEKPALALELELEDAHDPLEFDPIRKNSTRKKSTLLLNDEKLMAIFIGQNSEKFMPLYRGTKHKFSFNITACLFPPVWFFYRKLYVEFLLIALALTLPFYFFPDFPNISTGVGAAFAGFSNLLYLSVAKRRINKIKALNLPKADLMRRLAAAGGTSPIGAAIGTLIIVVILALSLASA